MFVIIGVIIVIASITVGYGAHGDFAVLMQPFEVVIIVGAAFGAFLISNPKSVIMGVFKSPGRVLKGPPHKKASYVELLTLLYAIFRLAKSKGMLALESHIENPAESTIFSQHPKFMANHHAVHFLSDYLRLMTMGTENPHELETLIDEDIETHHAEAVEISTAVSHASDGLPAFGIVAAVLGVIITMGSITEPPEVLGELIGPRSSAPSLASCWPMASSGRSAPTSRPGPTPIPSTSSASRRDCWPTCRVTHPRYPSSSRARRCSRTSVRVLPNSKRRFRAAKEVEAEP